MARRAPSTHGRGAVAAAAACALGAATCALLAAAAHSRAQSRADAGPAATSAPTPPPSPSLAELVALAGAAGPRVAIPAPTARSFCGSPHERWVRASLGARLGPCDAPQARMTLRAADRLHDRLDAQWSTAPDAGEELRRGTWVLAPGEVLGPRDPRRVALLADPPRGPHDAWRAALLALIDEGGCEHAFDELPAGLGAAGEAVPSGVYGDARRGYSALVWARCPVPGGREGAVAFRLRRVELTAGRGARVIELALYCRGRSDCVPPPTR